MSLISEIVTAVASLTGATVATNLFAGTLPASPTVCTAVLLTGGPFNPANPTRGPTFQIVHRNTHVSSGAAFVTAIHSGLSNGWNVLPTIPARIEAVTEPGAYAYVGDRWPLFSLNFRAITLRPW